jgi:hypothetical protein
MFYYTNDSKNLYKSLRRFFNYLLNQNLTGFNEQGSFESNQGIFICKDEKDNPEPLKIIAQSNIKTITLGFDYNSSLNLLDFANLKENFYKVITNRELYFKELYLEEEIKEKLKNFFHSHGGDSLFEYLNWTYYFLSNGVEQFIKNEITYEEYQQAFLMPGLKKWDYFKSRFVKYKDIIKFSIYKATLDDLKIAINEADNYINELSRMDKEEILRGNIDFYNEKIEKVKKIDDILSRFYRKLSFEGSPLQNTSGR